MFPVTYHLVDNKASWGNEASLLGATSNRATKLTTRHPAGTKLAYWVLLVIVLPSLQQGILGERS